MTDLPGIKEYPDAWREFTASKAVSAPLLNARPDSNDAATLRYGWLCFLAGWTALKQRPQVRPAPEIPQTERMRQLAPGMVALLQQWLRHLPPTDALSIHTRAILRRIEEG